MVGLVDVVLGWDPVADLIVEDYVAILVVLYLVAIVVQVDLVAFAVVFLVGLSQLLHPPASLVQQYPLPLSVSHHLQPLICKFPVHSTLLINHHQQTLLVVECDSAVDVPLDSVAVVVDEPRVTVGVSDQFVAVRVEAMGVSLCVGLEAIASWVVLDDGASGEDGDCVALLVVAGDVAVFILDYSEAGFIVFLADVGVWVASGGETISRVVGLPLTMSILADELPLLVLEQLLGLVVHHLPPVFVKSVQFALLVYLYLQPFLVNVLLVLAIAYHPEAKFVEKLDLVIDLSHFEPSLVMRFAV